MIDEGVDTPTAIIVPRAASAGVALASTSGVLSAAGVCGPEPGCAAVLSSVGALVAAGDGEAGACVLDAPPALGAAAPP